MWSGSNLSMTYGRVRGDDGLAHGAGDEVDQPPLSVRGQGDLRLLHREDHRVRAAQVGDVGQQGEHQHVERAGGQPAERHRVGAGLGRDEHAQHLAQVLPGQVRGVHADGRVVLRHGQEPAHPGQHLVADLGEPRRGLGQVDAVQGVQRAGPQRPGPVRLQPDDGVDQRAAAEAQRPVPGAVRPQVQEPAVPLVVPAERRQPPAELTGSVLSLGALRVREERVPGEVVFVGVEPAQEHHRQAPLADGQLGHVIAWRRREVVRLGVTTAAGGRGTGGGPRATAR